MKKRVLILLMAGCMTCGTLLTGCGSMETVKAAISTAKAEKEVDKEADEKDDKEADGEDGAGEDKDGREDEEKDGKAEKKGDYRNITEETIISEESESEFTVAIPDGEYASVEGDMAYCDRMGVEVSARLDPYIQYEQEDYSMEENLEALMECEFDEFYTTDYKDLKISEAEPVGEDAAVASAQYCQYDSWEEEYNVYSETYYLEEVEPGTLLLVETTVNAAETTGKTDGMLEEIEDYYGFDVDWDADEADAKLENFLANGDGNGNMASTGFLKFELPEGWEKDETNSSYEINVYAPDGDTAFSKCAIAVYSQYGGSDMDNVAGLLGEQGFVEDYIKEQLVDEVSGIAIEQYGKTCIGDTVLIECTYEQDEREVDCRFYLSGKGSYIYAVQALQFPDAEEDAFAAAENILETGKLNE